MHKQVHILHSVMKLPIIATLTSLFLTVLPTRGTVSDMPEGWARCTSIYSADDYNLTGGADGSLIVLRSNGKDMRDIVYDAVTTHDVVIFDGKGGDFEISSAMYFISLSGKSLIGVNGACFRTTYSVPQEVRDMLDEMDVNSLSGVAEDNLGGTLSNGIYVAEQKELTIRQALIDRFGDPTEPYRNAGVFSFNNCSNIIIRNLDFAGPGSLDVGGADLLTLYECDHAWVDHCRFTDGLDGNLDIVNNSDFITVSDCHFRYTGKSYNHPLSNLTSGTEITDGSPQKNNISWFRCYWDEGCLGRMPFVCFGIQHIMNCYWDCTKGTCIDARSHAKVLIEKSFFTSKISNPLAIRDNTVAYDWRSNILQNRTAPESNATVSVPYKYTAKDVLAVVSTVKNTSTGAGPTLTAPYTRELSTSPSVIDFGRIYSDTPVETKFNISAYGYEVPSSITLTAPDGVVISTDPDGNYSSSLRIDAGDESFIQADIYVKAKFNQAGIFNSPIVGTTSDRTYNFPLSADVVGLNGEKKTATIQWPLDKGTSNQVSATTNLPDAFNNASFGTGEKIFIHSAQKLKNSQVFTLFNPTDAIGKVIDRECFINFDVTSAQGYVFVPTKLRFNAARIGTDMCLIDVECFRDSESPQKLLTVFQPARSNDYSEIELPLNNSGVGESLHIRIYLYNMSANKQLAIRDFVIEGDVYATQSDAELTAADGKEEPAEYFDLQGMRVENPQAGKPYVVRNGSNSSKKIIYTD